MPWKCFPIYPKIFVHKAFPIDAEFCPGHVIYFYIEPLIPAYLTEKFTKPYVIFRLHNQFFPKKVIHKYHDTTSYVIFTIFFNAF